MPLQLGLRKPDSRGAPYGVLCRRAIVPVGDRVLVGPNQLSDQVAVALVVLAEQIANDERLGPFACLHGRQLSNPLHSNDQSHAPAHRQRGGALPTSPRAETPDPSVLLEVLLGRVVLRLPDP